VFDTLQDNNRNIVTWYKHTGFILESIKTLYNCPVDEVRLYSCCFFFFILESIKTLYNCPVDEVRLYSCCFFFFKLSSHSGGTHNTIWFYNLLWDNINRQIHASEKF